MTHKTKTISVSFLLFISSIIGIFIFFLTMVYFKVNPSINVNEQKLDPIVDSALIIRQKDSIIDVLNKDNVRLKKMFDEKPDTIWVHKPVYLKQKIDTLN